MKLIVCASLLVSFFNFVCPQCTEPQWEGVRQSTTDYLYFQKGEYGLLEEYAVLHYDNKNKRSFINLSTHDAGKIALYNILTLYKDGKGVRYTSRYYPFHPCVKETLTGPFKEKCVPDGAMPTGRFSLGGPGALKVASYSVSTESQSTSYVVAEGGNNTMVPVMESVKGQLGEYEIFKSVVFKNITDGIKDTNIFKVPQGCKEGNSDLLWLAEDKYPPKEHSLFTF